MTISEKPTSLQDSGTTGVARKYSKRVCATCRRRHYKCDGVGPPSRCAQCKIAGLECVWSDKTRAPSRSNDVAELRERLAILESTVELLVARIPPSLGNSIASPITGGTSKWTVTPAPASDFASLPEPGTDPLDPLLPARSAIAPSNLTWCAPSTRNDFPSSYQFAQPSAAASIPAPGVWTADASTSPLPNPSGPAVLSLHQREGALPEDVRITPAAAREDFANAAGLLGLEFLSEMWGRDWAPAGSFENMTPH